MSNNRGYWKFREERKEHAEMWLRKMETEKAEETNKSIKATKIYPENFEFSGNESTKNQNGTFILLEDLGTVEAILKYGNDKNTGKMAALNFASYKNPGGMFLRGSSAQEECLCHSSNLYLVLRAFEDSFYAKNRKTLNYALYTDNALYTPNVYFSGDGTFEDVYCDIITCAAPNRAAAERYHMAEHISIRASLISRISQVLSIASDNDVETIILGAFGCGVFGNDAKEVSGIFKYFLDCEFRSSFKNIIFAIPDAKSNNYKEFFKTFMFWEEE